MFVYEIRKEQYNQVITSEKLIIVNFQARDKETVVRELGLLLLKYGYVNEGFIEAVLEREKKFPTGLPTEIPVAVPHTEAGYCNQNAIAIATLSNAVTFHEMGNCNKELQVSIVVMLAIKEPEEQIRWLQKLVTIFKHKDYLEKLMAANTSRELSEAFTNYLN